MQQIDPPTNYEITFTPGRVQPYTGWFHRPDGKRETFAFGHTYNDVLRRCVADAREEQPTHG